MSTSASSLTSPFSPHWHSRGSLMKQTSTMKSFLFSPDLSLTLFSLTLCRPERLWGPRAFSGQSSCRLRFIKIMRLASEVIGCSLKDSSRGSWPSLVVYSSLALALFTLSLPSYAGQLDRRTYEAIPSQVTTIPHHDPCLTF